MALACRSSVAAIGFGLTAYPIGVERGYISIIRTCRNWQRERASSFCIAPRDPPLHFSVEFLKLLLVVCAFTRVKIEAFVPAAFIKDTLFRIATEKLFADDRLAVLVFALDHAHLFEQRNKRGVLFHRRGNVMSAPRKRDRSIRTGARRAARSVLEFEENEIVKIGVF